VTGANAQDSVEVRVGSPVESDSDRLRLRQMKCARHPPYPHVRPRSRIFETAADSLIWMSKMHRVLRRTYEARRSPRRQWRGAER
jgi:hypothetical protein